MGIKGLPKPLRKRGFRVYYFLMILLIAYKGEKITSAQTAMGKIVPVSSLLLVLVVLHPVMSHWNLK